MRKALAAITFALVLAATAVGALAQGTFPQPVVYAEQFNNWDYASQGANQFTFSGTNCFNYPLASGIGSYFVFGPTASPYPVLIQDANPSNSEIVTPSSTSTVSGSCGFTAAPSHSHTSFYVSSGTAGLQDAVGALGTTSAGVVVIDRYYYGLVAGLPGSKTVGAEIYGLKGSTGVQVVDITTTPYTYYAWNGSHYFANGGGTPSIAAGAGLGTGPTGLTVTGNGAGGTISVTTGTSTATGTLFTLTFLSGTTSTGFNHSPSCSIASVGATTPAGTLAAGSVGGSSSAGYTQPFTIATTALTASTFYSFSYSCN